MDTTRRDPRHSIQVVAQRTGLNADVIRAWERRHNAVRPRRTDSRRRLYSDEDIHRLGLLREAILAGRRIGDVAHLELERLVDLVREDRRSERPAAPPPGDPASGAARYLERCLAAALRLDAHALEIQLGRAAMELDVTSLFERVLSPMMRRIGERWLDGASSIAHEHMTTSVVRALLETMRTAFNDPASPRRLVATTLAGQHHELGALEAAVVAAMDGWQATYLGADLPATEIAAAAEGLSAHVVALSLLIPERDGRIEAELGRLREALPRRTAIVAGGEAASRYAGALSGPGATLCRDMRAFRLELRRLAAEIDGSR